MKKTDLIAVFTIVLLFICQSLYAQVTEKQAQRNFLESVNRKFQAYENAAIRLSKSSRAYENWPDTHPATAVSSVFSWFGEDFDIYLWRSADGAVWVELEPINSQPFVCGASFDIFQNGSFRLTDDGEGIVKLENRDGSSFCDNISEKTVFKLKIWSFLEDKADLTQPFDLYFCKDSSILMVFVSMPALAVLPVPDKQQFILSYPAIKDPVVSSNVLLAKPIAVGKAANESGALELHVKTDSFAVPMDAYFALVAPIIAGDTIFFITADGIQPISNGIIPWKTNLSSIDNVPIDAIDLALLPGDSYQFYFILVEAGKSPLSSNFYIWQTELVLTPTIEQLSQNMTWLFPDGVDAPMAMLQAFDNGYSLQQVVKAMQYRLINKEGLIFDARQQLQSPELPALNLITEGISDRSARNGERLSVIEYIELQSALKNLDSKLKKSKFLTLLAERPNLHILELLIYYYSSQTGENSYARDRLLDLLLALKDIHYRIVSRKKIREVAIQILDGLPEDQQSKILESLGHSHGIIRNRPPVFLTEPSFITRAGEEIYIALEIYDPDNDELTITHQAGPRLGELRNTSSKTEFYYTATDTKGGDDNIVFSVSDGWSTAEVNIEIVVKPLVLELDKVIFSKSNANPSDRCADVTENSKDMCIQYQWESSFIQETHDWKLSEGIATYHYKAIYDVRNEFDARSVLSDYNVKFNFDSPPSTIIPGETLPLLKIELNMNGFTKGMYISNSMRYFLSFDQGNNPYFNIDTSNGSPQQVVVSCLNRDLPYDADLNQFKGSYMDFKYTQIIVPENATDGFTIGGRSNWDPGMSINWIYKIKE